MKKIILVSLISSLLIIASAPRSASSAAMNDYCVVPPYVIQNVQPNVMMVLDNSFSMLNFAYYGGFSTSAIDTSAADGIIDVNDVTGFKVGDKIAIYTIFNIWAGGEGNGDLTITAIDAVNNRLSVSYSLAPLSRIRYSVGAQVVLRSRASNSFVYQIYDAVTAETTTAAVDSVGDNIIEVASVSGFSVGDRIAIYTTKYYWEGGFTGIDNFYNGYCYGELTITAIDSVAKTFTVSYPIAYTWLTYNVGNRIVLVQKAGAASPYSSSVASCWGSPAPAVLSHSASDRHFDRSFDPNSLDMSDLANYPGYYGYFNPTYWYTYTSAGGGRFVKSVSKATRSTKLSNEWDGNFLNWLTMKRIDVVRRALTGGSPSGSCGSGCTTLGSEIADCFQRGNSYLGSAVDNMNLRAVNNVQSYIDTSATGESGASGTRCFWVKSADDSSPYTCDGSGAGVASFVMSRSSACVDASSPTDSSKWSGNTYAVQAATTEALEGVLHSVVGTRARVGLAFYKPSAADHGSFVQVDSRDLDSLSSTINQINITRPNAATTPLGEALWSMAGYYAQTETFTTVGGPGPRFASGDYQINDLKDPLNYGTGGLPYYPQCAKNYVLLLTDGEPCADGNLPGASASVNILNYAAGKSDFNCSGSSCPQTTGAGYSFPATTIPGNPYCSSGNVAGLEDVALWSHTTDLRDTALGTHDIERSQALDVFVVHAFGSGSTLLKYAAINGAFQDGNGNLQPDVLSEWDENGDGNPDTFFAASSGSDLERKLRDAFSSMLRRASSGTAASVLASGEGSGASLIQAVFYPRRRFGNEVIAWTGALQNFWYFVDPFFLNNTVLEDTDSDQYLDLGQDMAVRLYFDEDLQSTRADLFLTNSVTGAPMGNAVSNVALEDVNYLWEAGLKLWQRDITNSTEARSLYTPDIVNAASYAYNPESGASKGLMAFVNSSAATFEPFMDVADATEAATIIDYTHGYDINLDPDSDGVNEYRDRKVTIASISNTPSVWKLGDILNSTPKIATWLPLNGYDKAYGDATYQAYVSSAGYASRGTIFAGGNDGMLHAFKLGTIQLSWGGQLPYQKARLTGSELGKELWGYIPTNVLPYLKHIADIEYCHLYTVDLSPYIFDASIGIDGAANVGNSECSAGYENCVRTVNSWRTIIIGGMRYGGGCREAGAGCTDCVEVPVQIGSEFYGYSSYFALDITDPEDPILLWEFAADDLGFSTTGPAVVRINGLDGLGNQDTTRNGKWFVVFGSGPTGPIDTDDRQFMGRSDQNLRFYALDLRTGAATPITTTIQKAFAGSMVNVTVDPDGDYQDDALYVGYTKRTGTNPNYTWTAGGVGRIWTRENLDPNQWTFKEVINSIGPVTASVASLKSNTDLWLYFGSGRYFFDLQNENDDYENTRYLYGVSDPCYLPGAEDFDATCNTVLAQGDLGSADSAASTDTDGWYITMDPYSAGVFGAERVITDPLASTTGVVFFTSFRPYDQVCGLGGKSYIWAVDYATGWVPSALKGSALIQVSTGSIERVDLGSVFTDKGGRRSASMEGVPPTAQGFSLFLTPPPLERMIHVRER